MKKKNIGINQERTSGSRTEEGEVSARRGVTTLHQTTRTDFQAKTHTWTDDQVLGMFIALQSDVETPKLHHPRYCVWHFSRSRKGWMAFHPPQRERRKTGNICGWRAIEGTGAGIVSDGGGQGK